MTSDLIINTQSTSLRDSLHRRRRQRRWRWRQRPAGGGSGGGGGGDGGGGGHTLVFEAAADVGMSAEVAKARRDKEVGALAQLKEVRGALYRCSPTRTTSPTQLRPHARRTPPPDVVANQQHACVARFCI